MTEKDEARERLSEPGEQWRPIPGFDGAYEVSNHGRVLTWKLWRGRPPPPRIMRFSISTDGTARIQLGLHGGTHVVDKLVSDAFPEENPT